MKQFALRAGYLSDQTSPEIISIWTTEEGVKAEMKRMTESRTPNLKPAGEVFKHLKDLKTNELTDGDYYIYYQEIYTDSEWMYNSPEEVAQWEKEWKEKHS